MDDSSSVYDEDLSELSIPSVYDKLKDDLKVMGYEYTFEEKSTKLVQSLLKDLVFCHEKLERTMKSAKKSKVSQSFLKKQNEEIIEENKKLLNINNKLHKSLQGASQNNLFEKKNIPESKLKELLEFERHKTKTLEARLKRVYEEKGILDINQDTNVISEPGTQNKDIQDMRLELQTLQENNEGLKEQNEMYLQLLQTRYDHFVEILSNSIKESVSDETMVQLVETATLEYQQLKNCESAKIAQTTKISKNRATQLGNELETSAELQEQNDFLQDKIKDLTDKIELMNEKFQKLIKESNNSPVNMVEVHKLEKQNMDLVLVNENLKHQNELLATNLSTMEAKLTELQKIVVTESELQNREKYLMLENEVEEKDILLRQARIRNRELKKILFEYQEKVEILEVEQFRQTERKTVTFKDDNLETRRLKHKLQNLNAINIELKSKFSTIIQKYQSIETIFTKLKQDKVTIFSLYRESVDHVTELQSEVEKYKRNIRLLIAKLKKQQAELKTLSQVSRNYDENTKKLILENKSKDRELKRLNQQLKGIEKMKKENKKQDITLKELMNRENAHNMEKINLNIEIEKLQNRVKVSENEISILNNLLSSERKNMEKLEATVFNLRNKQAEDFIQKQQTKSMNSMATGESSASEIITRNKIISETTVDIEKEENTTHVLNSEELERQCKELEEMISEQSQILRELEG